MTGKTYLGFASARRCDPGPLTHYRFSFFLHISRDKNGKPRRAWIQAGCRFLSFRNARSYWKYRNDRAWMTWSEGQKYNQKALALVAKGQKLYRAEVAKFAKKHKAKKKTRRRK